MTLAVIIVSNHNSHVITSRSWKTSPIGGMIQALRLFVKRWGMRKTDEREEELFWKWFRGKFCRTSCNVRSKLNTLTSHLILNSAALFVRVILKKEKVSNDQDMVQSERNSHS